ncbi:MAG: hypothetical protein R3F62_18770 [Planctomycetota bacterium]
MDAPPLFAPVVGHPRAKQRALRALEAGRLVGSVLLVGREGVGRTLFARELARAFVDPEGGTGAAGRRVLRGTHADVVPIEPAEDKQSISIEQVRETLVEMSKAPVEGHGRAFVFEPASGLGEDAQNALLKGLEEPSPRTLVILVARAVDEVLTTIASRCQVIELEPLSLPEVEEVLRAQGVPADEVRARAAWSGGRPGVALAEEALELGELAGRASQALADGEAYRDSMSWVDTLAGFVDAAGSDAPSRRGRLLTLFRVLSHVLRDALVLGRGAQVPRLSGAEAQTLERLAALPSRRLERALERITLAGEEVLTMINPTLVLEGLVLDVGATLSGRGGDV